MKKNLLLFLFLTISVYSQSYIPDASFGTSGSITIPNVSFNTTKGVSLNNDYYLLDSNTVLKINHNGTVDTNFGPNGNGKITLPINNPRKFVHINGFFYFCVSGSFIAKLDENFNFDTTFGTNGKAFAPSGVSLSSFTIDQEGNYHCTGSKSNSGYNELCYFKLLPDGSVDYNFDPAGYKSFSAVSNTNQRAIEILPWHDDFIIVGTGRNSDYSDFMFITKIFRNGNIDTSFGTNGYTIRIYNEEVNFGVEEASIIGDKVYIATHTAHHGDGRYAYLLGYDVVSGNFSGGGARYSYTNYKFYNDKIYGVNYHGCTLSLWDCGSVFMMQRFNLPGMELDNTFYPRTNSLYQYAFPAQSSDVFTGLTPSSESHFLLVDDSGKLLIVGNYIAGYNPDTISGLAMHRLVEGELSTETKTALKATVSPNPFTDHVIVTTPEQPTAALVYDLTGRLVAKPQFSHDATSTTINLSNITQKGIYMLKLNFGDKTVSQKIIKQ